MLHSILNKSYLLNKPVFYILLRLWLCVSFQFPVTAQENLVPNGSFEEYHWCPSYAEGYYINACKYWTTPSLGSSDYFNECSTDYDNLTQRFLFSVPENYIGYQYARTGNAYAGFAYTQIDDPSIPSIEQTFSEYIQVELKQKLEQGKLYSLRFYVSNASTIYCGNSIGAYFSPDELQVENDHTLEFTPHYQSDLSFFFCDSTKWFEQEYTFVADGMEKYLIIGVFTLLFDSQTSNFNGEIISGPGQFGANQYFYIDDVSLVEVEFDVPNVFTPNGDWVNDQFVLNGIPSDFSITVLNRWGQTLFQTDNINTVFWDGTYDGKNCPEGVYFYLLINEKINFRKTGYVHLIR